MASETAASASKMFTLDAWRSLDGLISNPTPDLSGNLASIILENVDQRILVADSCYMRTFQKPEWME